jgi:hypothetical protein
VKLTATTKVSVDGVMQAEGGPNVLDAGFERGDGPWGTRAPQPTRGEIVP